MVRGAASICMAPGVDKEREFSEGNLKLKDLTLKCSEKFLEKQPEGKTSLTIGLTFQYLARGPCGRSRVRRRVRSLSGCIEETAR